MGPGHRSDSYKKEWPEFDEECLLKIVRTDEKGRYSYDEAGVRIRANQGHSVPVGVELKEAFMPEEWGRRVYILSLLKSGLADPKGSCGVYRASVSGTSNRT